MRRSLFLIFIFLASTSFAEDKRCGLCVSANIDGARGDFYVKWEIRNCSNRQMEFMEDEFPWRSNSIGAILSAEVKTTNKTKPLDRIYLFEDSRRFVTLDPNEYINGETRLRKIFPHINEEMNEGGRLKIVWQWKAFGTCKSRKLIANGVLTIEQKEKGTEGLNFDQ